jgi:hypothetical protein
MPPELKAAIASSLSAQDIADIKAIALMAGLTEKARGKTASMAIFLDLAKKMRMAVLVTGGDAPSFELYLGTDLVTALDGEKARATRLAANQLQNRMAKSGIRPWTQAEIMMAIYAQQMLECVVAACEP